MISYLRFRFRWRWRDRTPSDAPPRVLRQLFLDDDPARAAIFLAENPSAVWVQTAAECIARLEETWDEVHLDHDLGGEHFVDLNRDDCGMEVVRWLSLKLRPHLSKTRFQIHSHNPVAATMMGMQMLINGYHVQVRPFGAAEPVPLGDFGQSKTASSRLAALRDWIRGRIGRRIPDDISGGGDPAARIDPPPETFDFRWQWPGSSSTMPAGDPAARADEPDA